MPEFDPHGIEILFWDALALIVLACIFVPVFKRLGLGSVLGYLAAGLATQLIFADSFTDHPEELLHFAEFGVVLFLFIIGLELNPKTLWSMRRDIFGMGFAQVMLCGVVLTIPALLFGISPQAATVIGFGLALSSTALVLQMLAERKERATLHGRKSFAILLFQDLAIVPLLLMVTLLAPSTEAMTLTGSITQEAMAVGAILALILIGRYALEPMFQLLARTGMPEIMTASALGIVLAAGLLMDLVGMSYAMGSFIAGVMLAESAYRHEVEANIEPFRGLFLGLFFIAVGLSLDLQAVADNWELILIVTPAALIAKSVMIYGVVRLFGVRHDTAIRVSLILPQHGEFGFVMFTAAVAAGLFDPALAAILIAIVTLSMAVTPVYVRLEKLLIRSRSHDENMEESFEEAGARALVIGFGKFGQIVAQPLFASGIGVTILDNDAERVRRARQFGFRVYFGDGTRRDVLRAAGAAKADIILVCVNKPERADQIIQIAKSDFPEAKLYVRAYDRGHAIRLIQADVDYHVRETFESALRLGKHALMAMGADEEGAARVISDIRDRDRERLRLQVEEGDLTSGGEHLHRTPVIITPDVPKQRAPDERAAGAMEPK